MQMQTERGLIYVEMELTNTDDAENLGFSYAFHSTVLGAKCFSKITTDLNHRVFCIVRD